MLVSNLAEILFVFSGTMILSSVLPTILLHNSLQAAQQMTLVGKFCNYLKKIRPVHLFRACVCHTHHHTLLIISQYYKLNISFQCDYMDWCWREWNLFICRPVFPMILLTVLFYWLIDWYSYCFDQSWVAQSTVSIG